MKRDDQLKPIFSHPKELKDNHGEIYSRLQYFEEDRILFHQWIGKIDIDDYKKAVYEEVDLLESIKEQRIVTLVDTVGVTIDLFKISSFIKKEITPRLVAANLFGSAVVTGKSNALNFGLNYINELIGPPFHSKMFKNHQQAEEWIEKIRAFKAKAN